MSLAVPHNPPCVVPFFSEHPDSASTRLSFPSNLPATSQLSELREMQQLFEDGRKWAMFMVAGGHFAGAVVRVSKPEEDEEIEDGIAKRKKKPKKPKPDIEILNIRRSIGILVSLVLYSLQWIVFAEV